MLEKYGIEMEALVVSVPLLLRARLNANYE